MQKILIYTDGGARGNPGPAGAGVVILDAQGAVLKEISDYLGEVTNNVAEYEALTRALKAAHKMFGGKLGAMVVEVRMDSELIVRQMEGRYKVKNLLLKKYFAEIAMMRLEHFPNISFVHIPREKNKLADALVNEAIDRGISK